MLLSTIVNTNLKYVLSENENENKDEMKKLHRSDLNKHGFAFRSKTSVDSRVKLDRIEAFSYALKTYLYQFGNGPKRIRSRVHEVSVYEGKKSKIIKN